MLKCQPAGGARGKVNVEICKHRYDPDVLTSTQTQKTNLNVSASKILKE